MFEDFFQTVDALLGECTNPKVLRLAQSAQKHAQSAAAAHVGGTPAEANAHFAQAAQDLHDAAVIHAGKMKGLGQDPHPLVLDAAHLGKAQELHQEYVNQVNEGLNNGR